MQRWINLQTLIATDYLLDAGEAVHEVVAAEAVTRVVVQVRTRTEHGPRLVRDGVETARARLTVAQQRRALLVAGETARVRPRAKRRVTWHPRGVEVGVCEAGGVSGGGGGGGVHLVSAHEQQVGDGAVEVTAVVGGLHTPVDTYQQWGMLSQVYMYT